MPWVVLLAVAAFILSLLALRWLWKSVPYGRTAVAALLISAGTGAYLFIYPPDAYYRAEFERLTRVHFPASGKIIFSHTATGVLDSYRSCAVFRVSAEDYLSLRRVLDARQSDEPPSADDRCSGRMIQQQGKPTGIAAHSHDIAPGKYLQWGVLDDGASVIYYTMRWKDLNPV